MQGKRLVGVGAALVDLLLEESDQFLVGTGSPKGGMTLSELHHIEGILGKTNQAHKIAPGGSACNTIVGFSQLGGRGSFIGMLGHDEFGNFFEEKIKASGVQSQIKRTQNATGRVLSLVTPDAQRTMFTHLGASAELHPEALLKEDFHDTGIVYLEGYLLFNEAVTRKVIEHAKEAGAKIALDLASFQVVEICRGLMDDLLKNHVDIVLANEDEAKAYTKRNEEDSLHYLADLVDIAVVKLGERGAMVKQGSTIHRVDAKAVKAIDTTGAGDLWAAGFLYGLMHGHSLDKSAEIGAAVAREVVSIVGAHIPADGWLRIKQSI